MLKPQDIVVALKLCLFGSRRPPFSHIAVELGMSPSEVHASIKRLQASRLVHGPELKESANLPALEEFLVHGLKYVFPAERGELTRGIPTSYAAEPLKSLIVPGSDPPPVWPFPEGTVRGMAFEPLYKTVPIAALRDSRLYESLSLVDALREGRSRERKLAEEELTKRLQWSSSRA
jgi:DNA-binding Lrp family transcriptional regulator